MNFIVLIASENVLYNVAKNSQAHYWTLLANFAICTILVFHVLEIYGLILEIKYHNIKKSYLLIAITKCFSTKFVY